MIPEMGALVEAVIKYMNDNYKTISELSRIMGYPTTAYLSRKVKKLKLGIRFKDMVILSLEDQEKLKNSIKRRVKED